jgi:hypothetical protein
MTHFDTFGYAAKCRVALLQASAADGGDTDRRKPPHDRAAFPSVHEKAKRAVAAFHFFDVPIGGGNEKNVPRTYRKLRSEFPIEHEYISFILNWGCIHETFAKAI